MPALDGSGDSGSAVFGGRSKQVDPGAGFAYRQLVNGAPVILADEPTGALDAAHAGELLDEFEALADQGLAVIVASHDGTVAARAHRVVELGDGVVVGDAGSESLRQEAAEDVLRRHRGAMPWLTVVRSGLAALGASRLRASLTVSSVALGTWSILALLSLVEGVGRDIAAAMERMDTNRLAVTPPMRAGGQLQRSPLTMDDAEALNDGVGNISAVIPSMWESFRPLVCSRRVDMRGRRGFRFRNRPRAPGGTSGSGCGFGGGLARISHQWPR